MCRGKCLCHDGAMEKAMIEKDERFLAQLKEHEGLRLFAYVCPAGRLTIGWGHNCEASPVDGVRKVGDRITRSEAERLLAQDVQICAEQLDAYAPCWRQMENARQAVLLNMCFNVGARSLRGFGKMWQALSLGNYGKAADEMLDSKWARKDVPRRAAKLAKQMRTGEWQE